VKLRHRAATLLFVFTLGACGDTCKSRDREITQRDLELMVWQQLKEKGKFTPTVYCTGPIDARVGEKITCYMMINYEKYDVKVVISNIEGSQVELDIEVADTPHDAGASR